MCGCGKMCRGRCINWKVCPNFKPRKRDIVKVILLFVFCCILGFASLSAIALGLYAGVDRILTGIDGLVIAQNQLQSKDISNLNRVELEKAWMESLSNFARELEVLTQQRNNIRQQQRRRIWQNVIIPPFTLELNLDKTGPKFSKIIGNYPDLMFRRYNVDEISGSSDVVVEVIMKNLLNGAARLMNSFEKNDPTIIILQNDLTRYMKRGLLPVDIYAQKIKFYMPVWNLDLANFMSDWEAIEHTRDEIKHTVEFHMKHMKEIEKELPAAIDISAFRLNFEIVKSTLLKKKQVLYLAILDSFAAKLRNQMIQIRGDYIEMERKLTTRSDDIEERLELKIYLESIPKALIQKEEQIQEILNGYGIFEKFIYPISRDDTNLKWEIAIETNRMKRLYENCLNFFKVEYNRLFNLQRFDMKVWAETIASISMPILKNDGLLELEKANEVLGEINKIEGQITGLQSRGDLLNRRQKIFGLPVPIVENEALGRLRNEIEIFNYVWIHVAETIRSNSEGQNETQGTVPILNTECIENEGEVGQEISESWEQVQEKFNTYRIKTGTQTERTVEIIQLQLQIIEEDINPTEEIFKNSYKASFEESWSWLSFWDKRILQNEKLNNWSDCQNHRVDLEDTFKIQSDFALPGEYNLFTTEQIWKGGLQLVGWSTPTALEVGTIIKANQFAGLLTKTGKESEEEIVTSVRDSNAGESVDLMFSGYLLVVVIPLFFGYLCFKYKLEGIIRAFQTKIKDRDLIIRNIRNDYDIIAEIYHDLELEVQALRLDARVIGLIEGEQMGTEWDETSSLCRSSSSSSLGLTDEIEGILYESDADSLIEDKMEIRPTKITEVIMKNLMFGTARLRSSIEKNDPPDDNHSAKRSYKIFEKGSASRRHLCSEVQIVYAGLES